MTVAYCLTIAALFAAPESLEAAVDAALAGPVKEGRFAGVVRVARDGKPLFRRAYGLADEATRTPHATGTRFMIFSVSKQFTAALILRLQDQKTLSVGRPGGEVRRRLAGRVAGGDGPPPAHPPGRHRPSAGRTCTGPSPCCATATRTPPYHSASRCWN